MKPGGEPTHPSPRAREDGIKPLRAAGINVVELSTSDVVVAFGDFLDEVNAGRLRNVAHPQLDTAVRYGMQRKLGGAATWERRGAPVDVSPLTGATWALRNAPGLQLYVFPTGGDDAA